MIKGIINAFDHMELCLVINHKFVCTNQFEHRMNSEAQDFGISERSVRYRTEQNLKFCSVLYQTLRSLKIRT